MSSERDEIDVANYEDDVAKHGTYNARKKALKSYKNGRRDKATQRANIVKQRKEAREWQEKLGHLW